jgi:hypothetical protein
MGVLIIIVAYSECSLCPVKNPALRIGKSQHCCRAVAGARFGVGCRGIPITPPRQYERPQIPRFRYPVAARRRRARPRHRRARHAGLFHLLVRVQGFRPRRRAVQYGARRPRVFAHLQPDQCGAGGAHRRAGRRRGGHRHRQRPGRDAPGPGTIAGAGSHIVASRALYGGSHNLLAYTLKRFGIDTTFVDPRDHRCLARRDPAQYQGAVRRDARQSGAGRAGHRYRRRLAHDHAPAADDGLHVHHALSAQPFDHGADLVFHSATKFLCGHGTAIGGLLVDGGTFDWQKAYDHSGRFAELCEPYDGFHGMVFAEESTRRSVCAARAARRLARLWRGDEPAQRLRHPAGRRDAGPAHGPACGQYAQGGGIPAVQSAVESVSYPDLPSHPDYELAKRLLPAAAARCSLSI